MADPETRAGDLLDRLMDCGLGDGMSEDDLLGAATREPLRTCCIKLAGRLWALCQHTDFEDPASLQAAVTALRRDANTEAAAGEGRLDACLQRLARVLDPASGSASRLEALELATAVLQAASMVASGNEQSAAAAAAAAVGAVGANPSAADQQFSAAAGVARMHTLDPLAYELSAALRAIASLLQLETSGAPSAADLAAAASQRVRELLAQLPAGFFEPLLQAGSLGEAQLAKLSDVDAALRSEYALRRRMLIERVKVTLQSFMWSPWLEQKGTKADAAAVVEAASQSMSAEPQVAQQDVFMATLADLLPILEKATSGETGIHASVKNVLIGKVPDRGGRPEGRKREAEMPAWTTRRVSHGGGGGGRGRGRGGGRHGGRGGGWGSAGGRVQAGWQGGSSDTPAVLSSGGSGGKSPSGDGRGSSKGKGK